MNQIVFFFDCSQSSDAGFFYHSDNTGCICSYFVYRLGGAIAIQLAATGKVPNLQGLIALDVVEGAALEALPAMKKFVEQFPSSFRDPEEAIEWSLRYGEMLCKESCEKISLVIFIEQRFH